MLTEIGLGENIKNLPPEKEQFIKQFLLDILTKPAINPANYSHP